MPESREPNEHLGVALFWAGEYERAIAQFRRLLALFPDLAGPRRALGLALLLLGRYEEGWREYEARLKLLPPRSFSAPRWNGEPLPGGAIYLHCEQGFGDSVHFIRYAPLVRAHSKAARVILECQPELVRLLLANVGWEAEIVPRAAGNEEPRLPVDAHLPLPSLPLVLGLYEPLPMEAPYLRADPALRAVWRERLGPASGLRLGLAWAGSPDHQSDETRSLAAEMLLPLLRASGVTFYSLQVGRGAAFARPLLDAGLIDFTAHLGDFADTAALLAELDLVVSVDTAVVHLAGAMGRPVWTLLAFVPDWRWGLEREGTPWYPTMRLFRQPALGDWDSVLGRVAAEVARFQR
jgi:tetratricopeptide (TPR) repeat protein